MSYLVFSYYEFYPGGAEADFVGHFDSSLEAVEAAKRTDGQFINIYDVSRRQWVDVDSLRERSTDA